MGERQFVSGARAVLVNPVIVLLDETMARVDSCNEHLIQKAMGRMLERAGSFDHCAPSIHYTKRQPHHRIGQGQDCSGGKP